MTNFANIRYLTGLRVTAGILLIRKNDADLFLDGRYSEAGKAVTWMRVRPAEELPKVLKKLRRVAFEESDITVERLSRWQRRYKNTKFVHSKGLVEGLRRVKDSEELHSIERACRITKSILRKIPGWLTVGTSELEISGRIELLAKSLGAEAMAFDTIVAFGENTSLPHHRPTTRKFQKGDIVQIDMGVKIDGYCSDMSRVFFTGRRTSEQARAYRALTDAKKLAERSVKVGVSNRALDRIARDRLKKYGYDKEFSHSLGHGVGLDIHEHPNLSKKAPLARLKRNEVITIEPGLYFSGKWGMRIEDTIVVR